MTHASVFSGIGGPEVAAAMLGWENLFHCEINEFGRRVLEYWFPKSESYEDIKTTKFEKWKGRVDVLTGGFPCQPFSYAGQRRGEKDDRYLWQEMHRAINEIKPTWIVAENVAGITTMVEQGEVSKVAGETTIFAEADDLRRRYELRETFTLERICRDIEADGYEVQPVLIPACAVGAPHRRDRVFIVARRKEESAAADSVGSGERTPRPSGEPESGRGDTHQQPSERRAATERLDRLHAVLRHATDTEGEPSERLRPRQSEVGRAQQEQSGGRGGEGGSERLAPHPDSHRGSEVDEHMESELADGAKPVSNGGQRNRWCPQSGRENEAYRRQGLSAIFGFAEGHHDYEVGERWNNFPSVSPVHRGNDGLPFDVGRLTLSFGKWRTEALKAYGNAIVPQVMYEIFRTIEQIEKSNGIQITTTTSHAATANGNGTDSESNRDTEQHRLRV